MPPKLCVVFSIWLVLSCWNGAAQTNGTNPSATAESIQPPFGRSWEDEPALLEKLLLNAKAQITKEKTSDGELWTVAGLQQGLNSVQFRFANATLAEVVLSYQRAEWSRANMEEFAEKVRERIKLKYGNPEAGKPVKAEVLSSNFWLKDGNGLHVTHRQDAKLPNASGVLQVRYFKDGREQVP